jgi:hypothetical protein
MKVVRLSNLNTGCLYLQLTSLVLISVRGLVDGRAMVQPEGLIDEKSQCPIVNRTNVASIKYEYIKT